MRGPAFGPAFFSSVGANARYNIKVISTMKDFKRATVYFDADVHQALRLRAAAADRPFSHVVNEALKAALAEDSKNLAAFDQRTAGRSLSVDSYLRHLRQRGRI